MTQKFILDACCGGKQMWYDKHHPNTLYIDNEPRAQGSQKTRPNWECSPDQVMDFTNLAFPDKSFKLVVWDPPHIRELHDTSIFKVIYGCLRAETWQTDLSKGFNEIWRVLEDYGILIFKWSENDIALDDVLKLFKEQPLFGHRVGSIATVWLCFMKIP